MELDRILLFISSLRRGGAEHHLLNLCRYLKRASITPAVCTLSPREDGLEAVILSEGISLFRLPLRSLRDLARPRVHGSLRRIVHSCRPAVIHAHLFHAEVVSTLASFMTRAPLVVTRHSAGLEFGGWRRIPVRLIRARAGAVVAVSAEAAAEALAMGFAKNRIVVVPNGIDTTRFQPFGGERRKERRLLLLRELFPGVESESCLLVGAAGGLKAIKNFPLFIRMANRIIAERAPGDPPVRFVVFGEGDDRSDLERLATGLGASRFLAMPGHRDDLEEVLGLLDIFVLTSFREGVPMVLLEAMSSGTACVASNVGGVAEVIGEAGLMVASGDEDGFVDAVRGLLSDDVRRLELARIARIRAMEHYDMEIWGERMLSVYGNLPARR